MDFLFNNDLFVFFFGSYSTNDIFSVEQIKILFSEFSQVSICVLAVIFKLFLSAFSFFNNRAI